MNNKDHLVGRLTSVLVHPTNTPLLPTRTGNGLGRQTRLHWILGPTNTNLRHSLSRKLLTALCGVLPVYIKTWHCAWYGVMQCIAPYQALQYIVCIALFHVQGWNCLSIRVGQHQSETVHYPQASWQLAPSLMVIIFVIVVVLVVIIGRGHRNI